ncbi:MAG: NAD-dependent epimerase/dehydratase family protein [Acidobacteriota bacterium]
MTVAITGASGYLGRRLLARLLAREQGPMIVALDLEPPGIEDPRLHYVCHDVRQPMTSLFSRFGVEKVVHLAFRVAPSRRRRRDREINVGGSENVLTACADVGVRALVVVSSATVYGAWPDHSRRLDEAAPLRGKPGFPYVEDKVRVEALVRAFAEEHAACRVVVARPSVVVGPGMDNYIRRQLSKRFVPLVAGRDPRLPVVHEDDVAMALETLLVEEVAGAYNLTAPGALPVAQVAYRLGGRVVRLPAFVLGGLARLAWGLGLRALSEAPPATLDYLRYSWNNDGTKIVRDTDFSYRYSTRAALLDSSRRAPSF